MRAAIRPELIEKYMADHAMMLGLPDVPDSESDEWRDWYNPGWATAEHALDRAAGGVKRRLTQKPPWSDGSDQG